MIASSPAVLESRLPARKSTPNGAGLFYCPRTRLLELATARQVARVYRLSELKVDRQHFFGRGFQLDKVTTGTDPEAELYTVLISDRGPAHDSCHCKGFLRWGSCSHCDGLRVVIAAGWVEDPAERPEDRPVTLAEVEDMGERAGAALGLCNLPARHCVICGRPLNFQEADRSGLAHADCAEMEIEDIAAGEERDDNR